MFLFLTKKKFFGVKTKRKTGRREDAIICFFVFSLPAIKKTKQTQKKLWQGPPWLSLGVERFKIVVLASQTCRVQYVIPIPLWHLAVGQNPVPPVTLRKPFQQLVIPTEKVP